ncbi:FAD-dependent oxidoreductase [Salipaludibacillus sp. HK11]|uniref:NAD(P)/FAD-dependent oxidoreductase n=1 Tax=Salipaludibacillus sp. HK11 TaxID=3394320 RepID=UPI0039FCE2A9
MYDIIVIGAGPAGASASLFAARAGKKTLMINSDQSMTKMAWLENHYGIPEITGPDLVETGLKQAEKFGAEVVEAKVSKVAKGSDSLKVETDKDTYDAKHVIFATGASSDIAETSGVATKEGTEPKIKKIVDVDRSGKSSVDGIWAAGTCAGESVHTIITAGHGATVAINVISELNGERYVDHDILKK